MTKPLCGTVTTCSCAHPNTVDYYLCMSQSSHCSSASKRKYTHTHTHTHTPSPLCVIILFLFVYDDLECWFESQGVRKRRVGVFMYSVAP